MPPALHLPQVMTASLVLALLGAPQDAKAPPEKAPPEKRTEAAELSEKADALFRKGEEARQGKEGKGPAADAEASLRQAAKLFGEIIERFPKDDGAARASYFLGSSHLLLEEPEKALPAYQRIVDGYPAAKNRTAALFRIGICHSILGEPLKARAAFAQVIRESRERPDDIKKAQKYIQELEIVGKPAPALRASRWMHGIAAGEGLKTFQGEVVAVVFFATWCKNCEKELAHLRSLIERFGKQGVVFVGVANPDDPENTKAVEPYVLENRLEFLDVALDRQEASWVPYRVFGFPAAAVIDRKGVVRWRGHLSFLLGSILEKMLQGN